MFSFKGDEFIFYTRNYTIHNGLKIAINLLKNYQE